MSAAVSAGVADPADGVRLGTVGCGGVSGEFSVGGVGRVRVRSSSVGRYSACRFVVGVVVVGMAVARIGLGRRHAVELALRGEAERVVGSEVGVISPACSTVTDRPFIGGDLDVDQATLAIAAENGS